MSAEPGPGRVRDFLVCGELEIIGYLPNASNATFAARCRHEDVEGIVVYKPRRGENPLWDFPDGTLCQREVAAYVVDQALGWELVPPTVLRDGPYGPGAVQLLVDFDDELDVRTLPTTHPDQLQRMTLFDVVTNNADRKAGHCLVDRDGHLWGVDHGICFHIEDKLRTIIWVYQGDPVPEEFLDDLAAVVNDATLRQELETLLSPAEINALQRRVHSVLETRLFPEPGPGRNVPWPPW